jgi:hypothetical protein
MGRYIKIQPSAISRYVDGRTQGYRMTMAVTAWENIDPNIFVYQIKNRPGFTGLDFYFVNIASPGDIEDYPIGQPADLAAPGLYPFFRLAEADLVFRNIQLLEDALSAIDQDVEGLIEAYDDMDQLAELTPIEHGSQTPSSSSSSSSSSS